MKPAAFDYHAPSTLETALELLRRDPDEALILAGGQSLVPTMAFRMARPAILVDINRIGGLAYVETRGETLAIGALVRHSRFETSQAEGPVGRLLANVAGHIAHAPIRVRGTFCGSLAHADPASEWCATTLALGGRMVCTSAEEQREVGADDWFRGVFTTALRPGEMLTEVRLPLLGPGWHCGFAEFSRRAGDFALAMAVAVLRVEDGTVREGRIALGGVGGTPVLAEGAVAALHGGALTLAAIDAAAARAAADCDPQDDPHAPAEYRRDLVRAMVRRALRQAASA